MAGRPRAFDAEAALGQIMQAFWDRGFAATSVDELQGRIGIQRGSFYAAFGDKESAWRQALDRYAGSVTAEAVAKLTSDGTPAERIAAFIRFVGEFLADNAGRGCLFLSAASQPLPAGRETRAHLARRERALLASIRRTAPEPVASYVLAVLLGLNAMARSGMAARAIRSAAGQAARAAAVMLAGGEATGNS